MFELRSLFRWVSRMMYFSKCLRLNREVLRKGKRKFLDYVMLCTIWYLFKDLNMKNTDGGVILLVSGLLKVALLHGCFSHFLNCTDSTQSRKASHILLIILLITEGDQGELNHIFPIFFRNFLIY